MADPSGITVNILTVLQLAAIATLYIKEVKGGSSDKTRLRDELRSTVLLLEMLKDRLEDDDDDDQDDQDGAKHLPTGPLTHSEGPVFQFQKLLENVIAKLDPTTGVRRIARVLTWPFDKKDVAEILAATERVKSHFMLVMQKDVVELSKLSLLKIEDVDTKLETAESKARQEETQKIIRWISSLSFRSKHASVLESVQPGTGTWFLEHDSFLDWTRGTIPMLWCSGIPGAGKTTLMSLAIDHVERMGTTTFNAALAFIYCDHNQQSEQTQVALLSSLLQQLLQQDTTGTLPPQISSLHSLHQKYGTRPTLAQIEDNLRQLVSRLTRLYVVIDALDELSADEEQALQFVSAVRELGPQVKVLCASRPSTTFQAYFEGPDTASLVVSARDHDIRTFLEAQLQQQHKLQRHIRADPALAEDIVKAVIHESQGMFLLAKLHIENLSQKINRKQVRTSLQTLPTTLDATYHNALERIYSQAPDTVDLAQSILFWVVCARRPFTVLELQHIYATQELDDDEVALEDDDLPDSEILTGACGGLVIVDSETRVVRVVHYTAQQYFDRCHVQQLLTAKMSLTKACLTYLTLSNFSDGVCTRDADMARRLSEYPFLDYAARHWGSEAGDLDTESLLPHIQRLASSPAAIQVASQTRSIGTFRYQHWSQEFPRDVPLLVLASAFDMPQILAQLLADGHRTNGHGSDGETAIISAAAHGRNRNIQVLLEHGADVNARDYTDESALFKAARIGDRDVVKTLVEHGAEINMRASSHLTPLMSAVASGSIDVVRLLVEKGADMELTTVWGDSALSMATRNGLEAIATYLADQGSVLPRGPAGRRASLVASRKGLDKLVRRLTASYTQVANVPLQRQVSRFIGGLPQVQEMPDEQSDAQAPESDDGAFPEALEESGFSVGFSRRYTLGEVLGKGHFASVHLCSNKATGAKYAAKVLKVQRWRKLATFRQETEVAQTCSHPNLLQLVDAFAEYEERNAVMVWELTPGGELFDLIITKEKFTEDEAVHLFAQIFSALEHLHGQGWVHRDIQPENILVVEENPLFVKIGDFGLAKKIGTPAGVELTTSLCGTPSYVSPEVLADSTSRSYGFPVDVWSCGVVLYICLCGFPPFSDELYSDDFPYTLSQQIKMGRFDYPSPYWDPIGDPALDLIDSMIVVDPKGRFDIKQCQAHPWSRGYGGAASSTLIEDAVRSDSPEIMGEVTDATAVRWEDVIPVR